MRSTRGLWGLLLLVALVGAVAVGGGSAGARDSAAPNIITAEVIGQVLNPSPAVGAQYGYVSYLAGLETSALTASGATLSEQSALLTFYSHTNTDRVINNGPMRVIDRSGEITFYLNPPTHIGNFNDAESFRQGTAVAVMAASLRHQVVVDTTSGTFTAHFDCTIARSDPFDLGGARYQLGKPGEHFEITVQGHLNTPAPPSGYMAGFVTGLELQPKGK